MRRTGNQTILNDLTELGAQLAPPVRDLATRFAELTKRLERAEARWIRGRRDPHTDGVTHEADDSSDDIEYVTENGFAIVRPWETGPAPAPTDGNCRFRVTDARGKERYVRVEASKQLIAETALHTHGRVQSSSSFWICCTERHLADYVWEHNAFPPASKLMVKELHPEEVILAMRWESAQVGNSGT